MSEEVHLRGGRNLLIGTSDEEQEVKTSSWSIGSWNPSLTIGEEYTFSFDIKSENATYLQSVFLNSSNNGFAPNTPISKKWTRVSFTFKWKGGTYNGREFVPHVYPRPDYSGTYVSRIKLEIGSTATPWTLAPEDLGLEYPDHVTKFDTYFKDEDLVTNELVEFPEELRGSRNLISEGNDLTKYYTSGYQNANFDIKPIDMSSEWGFSEAYRITTSGGNNNIKTTWSSSNRMSMEFGKDYTWSAHVKNLGDTTVHLNMNGLTGASTVILPPGFSGRVYRTGVRRESYNWFQVLPRTINVADSMDIVLARFKVTEGKAEDAWTPSPEDLGLVYPDHITHFGTYFKESNVLGYDLIGGRNLLLDSNKKVTNTSYPIQSYTMTEFMDNNKSYTITFKGDLGEGKSYFGAWLNGGSIGLGSFTNKGDGVYSLNFIGKTGNRSDYDFINIYPVASSVRVDSTIEWIKLEEGNIGTPWTPAPEDLGLEYPPSVTYFDKNPVVSSAVTNELVEFDKDSKGLDLRNKTDKISGEEIFTDKADNSVVHIEVDGKSYQEAGSGKNLAPHLIHWELSGGARFENGAIYIPSNSAARASALYKWGVEGTPVYSYDTLIGSNMHGSSAYYDKDMNPVKEATNTWTGNGYAHSFVPGERKVFNGSRLTKEVEYVRFSFTGSTSYVPVEYGITNIMIANSSDNNYEPPAPAPDYPIEIHSLNDFDVVSDVGRNLLLNTNREHETGAREYMSLPYDLTPIFEEHGLDQEYTMSFDLKSKDISNYDTIRIYPNPGTINPNRHRFPQGSFKVTTEYQRFSMTFKPTDGNKEKTTTYISVYGQYDTGNFPMLRNIKIEKGNKATGWTPAPEDITEDTNHPLIDKINLLLSEPLRSVGDVKDRFFRDSDGLWKIERNVGREVFENGDKWSNSYWYERDDSAVYGILSSDANYMMENGSISLSHVPEGRAGNSIDDNVGWLQTNPRIRLRLKHNVIGTTQPSSSAFKDWLKKEHDNGTPLTIIYELAKPTIETLDQDLQDKLNSLKSFKDSNYIYTINNTEGMPEDVKPTIHATFKSEDYGELAKDGLVYPDDITHLTTQVKYGTMVVSELIEGGGAYGDSTTRV